MEQVLKGHATQVQELLASIKQSTVAMESYRTELTLVRHVIGTAMNHIARAQMTKKLKAADKERKDLKTQLTAANGNALELVQRIADLTKANTQLTAKTATLEQLCRAMQADSVKQTHPVTAPNA